MRARIAFAVVVAAVLAGPALRAQPAQPKAPPPDPTPVLDQISQHLTEYYARAQSLVSREEVIQQPLKSDMSFDGMATRFAYQLRLEWNPTEPSSSAAATMMRQLLTVNGRVPKPKDKPKCMQPQEEWPEPLTMFLPQERRDYNFKWAGTGRMDGVETVSIDFEQRRRPSRSEQPDATTKQGVDDDESCVSYVLVGQVKGRVWVARETGEVLRLDYSYYGPFDIGLPKKVQSRWQSTAITIDRHTVSIRYKRVAFQDPEETLMLPESIQTVNIIRGGGAASLRMTQQFTNYRRFITAGRLVE